MSDGGREQSSGVIDHYEQEDLNSSIVAAVRSGAIRTEPGGTAPLAGVDEFHLGGHLATIAILDTVPVESAQRILDVGCGIGGFVRAAAQRADAACRVTGVDLTPSFVETARELTALLGLDDRIDFRVGDAIALPFDDDCFDIVTLIHVGMNVADKDALMASLGRVLHPAGTLVVYDIMRTGEGALEYPLPWASEPADSFVSRPDDYAAALKSAGLSVRSTTDRTELVRRAIADAQATPPQLDLSHLMGPSWPTMFSNLRTAMSDGTVSPVQITAG